MRFACEQSVVSDCYGPLKSDKSNSPSIDIAAKISKLSPEIVADLIGDTQVWFPLVDASCTLAYTLLPRDSRQAPVAHTAVFNFNAVPNWRGCWCAGRLQGSGTKAGAVEVNVPQSKPG